MRLQLVSDVHIEMCQTTNVKDFLVIDEQSKNTVLCVAGDFGVGIGAEELMLSWAQHFQDVVYVCGNHEYYHNDYGHINEHYEKTFKRTNVHWLNNRAVTIQGVKFLGTTLWSKSNPESPFWGLNDYHMISNQKVGHRRITGDDTNMWHNEAVDFLSNNITKGCVVVTHHLPSYKCIQKEFEDSQLNVFYASNLDKLIYDGKPALWLHGHAHSAYDINIGETVVMANAFGYMGNIYGFDPHKIIEL